MLKLSKSGQHLNFEVIAKIFEVRKKSLKLYFSENNPQYLKYFSGDTPNEIIEKLKYQISEVEKDACLNLLAAIEALFKLDYIIRCEKRDKDEISKQFKKSFAESRDRVSLENVIFEEWKKEPTINTSVISNLKGAFKYRRWLAHGRYWILKAGKQKYDFDGLYYLALQVNEFPLKK